MRRGSGGGPGGGAGAGGTSSTESSGRGGGPGHHIVLKNVDDIVHVKTVLIYSCNLSPVTI